MTLLEAKNKIMNVYKNLKEAERNKVSSSIITNYRKLLKKVQQEYYQFFITNDFRTGGSN